MLSSQPDGIGKDVIFNMYLKKKERTGIIVVVVGCGGGGGGGGVVFVFVCVFVCLCLCANSPLRPRVLKEDSRGTSGILAPR